MKDVRTGLSDHVDDRAAGEAILRAEVRLLDLEFLHGFDRGRIGDLGDAAVGLEVGDRGPSIRMSAVELRLPLEMKLVPVQLCGTGHPP